MDGWIDGLILTFAISELGGLLKVLELFDLDNLPPPANAWLMKSDSVKFILLLFGFFLMVETFSSLEERSRIRSGIVRSSKCSIKSFFL